MQVIVTKDIVKITDSEYQIHKGEYRANGVEYELSEEYEGLTCKAIFNDNINEPIEVPITAGTSIIPYEILSSGASKCELRVYGYETEEVEGETKLKLRYSPTYTEFDIRRGSYIPDVSSTEEITPSQFEQYSEKLNQGLEELEEAIESIEVDTSYARDMGDYAKEQGDYSKEQGDSAKELIESFSGTIQQIQNSIPKKVSDLPNDAEYITKSTNELTNYYKKEETYTKSEIDNKVSSVYKYKGSVQNYSELPLTGQTIGDVYNIVNADSEHGIKAGDNVAWAGTNWDNQGGNVDLSEYYTKAQTDNLLNNKVNNSTLNNYYDKTRTDELLNTKVDSSTYETKIQEIETNYVKNTDWATAGKGGVIKIGTSYGTEINNAGILYPTLVPYNNYANMSNYAFIGKGTLENVITGKELVNKTYVDDLVGDIATAIDRINKEVI